MKEKSKARSQATWGLSLNLGENINVVAKMFAIQFFLRASSAAWGHLDPKRIWNLYFNKSQLIHMYTEV